MSADRPPAGEGQPPSCPPCRGTGRVISHLGGSPSTVDCPWCRGTGRIIAGHDAQAARREAGGDRPDGNG